MPCPSLRSLGSVGTDMVSRSAAPVSPSASQTACRTLSRLAASRASPPAGTGDCPLGLTENAPAQLLTIIRDLPKTSASAPQLQAALEALSSIAAASPTCADSAVRQGAFSALAGCSEACFFAGVAEGVAAAAAQVARNAVRPDAGEQSDGKARNPEGLRATLHVLQRSLASFISMPSTVAAIAGALVRRRRSAIPPKPQPIPLFVHTPDKCGTASQAELYLFNRDLADDPGTAETMSLLVGSIANDLKAYARSDPHAALVRAAPCR